MAVAEKEQESQQQDQEQEAQPGVDQPDDVQSKEIEANRKKLIELQQQEREANPGDDKEVYQHRTKQQQEKYENLLKQDRRESGLQTNRSRSASRRARRKRIEKGQRDGKYMKTASLDALEEADANGELNSMQAFERIGPDSTSMDGPVTKARALRGEIPMRGTDPNQPYRMPQGEKQGGGLDEQDGLKLKLEANLEIEIELKASIRGDLTLSLLK